MRTLVSVVATLFAYVFLGIGAAQAQETQWTLIETTGPVFVTQPLGAPRFISLQEKIAPGSTLTTGGTGRAVVRRGEQNITIGPNSRIALPAAAANGMTRVIQDFGAAMFKVDKQKVQHFEVDTPMIAAVVKGTTFTVSVTPSGHSVHVSEGLVEVSMHSGGKVVPVPAGVTAIVSRDKPTVIELKDSTAGETKRTRVLDPGPSDNSSGSRAAGSGGTTVASLAIPQAIGAGPLDFGGLTNGLVGSGNTPAGAAAAIPGASGVGNPNAGGAVGAAASGNPNAGGAVGAAASGNPNAGGAVGAAASGNPNAGGAVGAAASGNPNAGGAVGAAASGNPNAGGAVGAIASGNPNAGGAVGAIASGNPNAGGVGAIASGNPNAGGAVGAAAAGAAALAGNGKGVGKGL